jgi:hypothetical protein
MKRTARLGRLIATSALTLGLLGGTAQAAIAASKPDGDFIVNCPQNTGINIEVNNASGGSIISQPTCSRDTFIR